MVNGFDWHRDPSFVQGSGKVASCLCKLRVWQALERPPKAALVCHLRRPPPASLAPCIVGTRWNPSHSEAFCPLALLTAHPPPCLPCAAAPPQPLIKGSMPALLSWILGGYDGELRHSDRVWQAREDDKPKARGGEEGGPLEALCLPAVHSP